MENRQKIEETIKQLWQEEYPKALKKAFSNTNKIVAEKIKAYIGADFDINSAQEAFDLKELKESINRALEARTGNKKVDFDILGAIIVNSGNYLINPKHENFKALDMIAYRKLYPHIITYTARKFEDENGQYNSKRVYVVNRLALKAFLAGKND